MCFQSEVVKYTKWGWILFAEAHVQRLKFIAPKAVSINQGNTLEIINLLVMPVPVLSSSIFL